MHGNHTSATFFCMQSRKIASKEQYLTVLEAQGETFRSGDTWRRDGYKLAPNNATAQFLKTNLKIFVVRLRLLYNRSQVGVLVQKWLAHRH